MEPLLALGVLIGFLAFVGKALSGKKSGDTSRVCPSCRGAKGESRYHEYGARRGSPYKWYDCQRCWGRGYV